MESSTTGLLARLGGALALAVLAARCGADADPEVVVPSATATSPTPTATSATPTIDARSEAIRETIAAIESAEWSR